MASSKTLSKLGTIRKVHCNTCNLQTPHELKNSSLRSKADLQGEGTEFEFVDWWEEYAYRFWVCQVCNTATLEISYTNMATEDEESSTWHPAPAKLVPMKFQRFRKKSLRSIYQEVMDSYNGGLKFSSASGLRVLLEGICVDMGIEDRGSTRSLTGKLYALAKRGLVKSEIVDDLFALKFIGDETIHHLKVPSDEDLETGIRIVESLISHLYKESEYMLSALTQDLAKKHPDVVETQKAKRPKNAT